MGYIDTFFIVDKFCAPLYLTWEITSECSCGCKYCYNFSGMKKNTTSKDLNSEEMLKIAGEIAQLFPIKITFSGGEPLERKELLFEVIGIIKRVRPGINIGMMTNGVLIQESDASFIQKNFSYVNINLNGAKEKVNPTANNINVCFSEVTRVAKLLDLDGKQKIELTLSFIPSKENIDEIDDIVTLSEEININTINVLEPLQMGRATLYPELLLGIQGKRKVIEKVSEIKLNHKNISIHFIDPSGYIRRMRDMSPPNADLYLRADGTLGVSPFIPFDGPNIREGELKVLWDQYLSRFWKNENIQILLKDFTAVNSFSPRPFCDPHIPLQKENS